MEEAFSDERKIDEFKPKMKTLERLDLLEVIPDQTVVLAKLDGEFSLLSYTIDGECYVLNKWGHRRTDFPALNQFIDAMTETEVTHVELLCELYAKEDGKPTKLPTFISYIKGEDKDLSKIHIGIWDLVQINGNPPPKDFKWKLEEVERWTKNCTHVSVVPYIMPRTLQDVKDFWHTYVEEQGYEGLVIRDGKHTYKIKPTLEVDAVIIGLNKKTSYGKKLDLFQKGQITSIKLALMQEDGTFIELSDCASGISQELRTVLWKLMDYKVDEDDRTVYITPVAVCTVQYTDTFHKRRQVLKFDKEYKFAGWKKFVSLRHPRLIRFRPDKDITPADLRLTQIPEDKLPKPEEEEKPKPTVVGKTEELSAEEKEILTKAPLVITPSIIMKPEDSFGEVKNKLYAEGWMVNSADCMRANTSEEAVKLQAKTFPCIEFQPVQLPDGKWVAFHRTPIKDYLKAKEKEWLEEQEKPPENPEEYCERELFGDYYNCIAEYRKNCPQGIQELCKERADLEPKEAPLPEEDAERKAKYRNMNLSAFFGTKMTKKQKHRA